MADPLWGQQLTNMWMLDPTMFDPSQKSNAYANPAYLNAPLPYPPTYNTDAGGPTNAMGQPIQSFVDWNNNAQKTYQQQLAAYNAQPAGGAPGGTTLNSTPAGAASGGQAPGGTINYAGMGSAGPAVQELLSNYQAAQAKLTPQQQYVQAQNNAIRNQMLQQQDNITATANAGGGFGRSPGGAFNPGPSYSPLMGMGGGQAAAPAAPAGQGPPPTPPNNWMAAINALSQPGNPVTQGANVPMAQGFQPSGGVNQAFLGQAGGLGNKNFLSALSALQGRKQA